MQKELARELLPLVNDHEKFPLLDKYIGDRITTMRTYLETSKDHNKILEIQGAIQELRRFATLRDEVLERAK